MIKYPLTYSTWGKQEHKAISKVISSNIFTMGKNVKKFEEEFANFQKKKYAVMVNSGSSANLIAIASLFYKKKNPLKRGDEVIVPGVSWSTTYAPLQQLGLKLKVIDIELKTFNIDFDKLKTAITKKTKLIVAVNLLGIPAELFKIKNLCKINNIFFFEDNCESLGAEINGKKAGSFGDLASHSFFFSHHICTMEGGMVVTDNYELFCLMKVLRAHGWSRDLPRSNPLIKINNNDFYEQYKFIIPGYNLRPGEINAAAGIEQLKKIKFLINERRKNLKIFNKYFKNNKDYLTPSTNYKSSSFAFPIIIRNNSLKFKLKIFNALKRNKIDFRLITGGCFTEHSFAKFFNYKVFRNLKNSEYLHKNGFFVGNASKDLSLQIKKLYQVLSNIK
jgi:CDP-6-deoxy-D-xylo-4-hexulose-3-dehydrase